VRELREAKDSVERTSGKRVAADRAIEWLRALSTTWTDADLPEAKADVLHAVNDQIVVTGGGSCRSG
jgi:truncated hemoglobin YjbI